MEWLENIVVTYFWHLICLCGSPIFGFAAGQRYKTHNGHKPNNSKIRTFAGLMTMLFATATWWKATGDISGALLLGAFLGMAQPFVIWVWLQVAKKHSPETYKNLTKETEDDKTYLPWRK